jgi:hypothetical protein
VLFYLPCDDARDIRSLMGYQTKFAGNKTIYVNICKNTQTNCKYRNNLDVNSDINWSSAAKVYHSNSNHKNFATRVQESPVKY